MRQPVSVEADLRWSAAEVLRVVADEVHVLFGARRPVSNEPVTFPADLRVPIGRHGAVSCAATVQLGPLVEGARALTITPATKRWLFPSLVGSLAVLARDSGCALALSGTASVPFGFLAHRRRGRRSLEQSLRDFTGRLATNVDQQLDRQARAEARRKLFPVGSPERRVRWNV